MCSYSSSVRPSLIGRGEVGRAVHVATSCRHLRAAQGVDHGAEEDAAVGAAGQLGLHGVLRVRHHAEHVARLVADAGDVVERAVGVGALGPLAGGVDVAHDDLVVGLHLLEGRRVDRVVALVVLDDDAQHVALRAGAGERRVRRLHAQVDVPADELEARVPDEAAGQEAGLDQDLEAVADAHHESAVRGEVGDGLHDGAEARDGAAAQVVAVAEPAGDDDAVDALEVGVLVPEVLGGDAGEGLERVVRVAVGVDAGEDDDADAQGRSSGHRGVTPR